MLSNIQSLADAVPDPMLIGALVNADASNDLARFLHDLSDATRGVCDRLQGLRHAADAVFQEAVQNEAGSEQLDDVIRQVVQLRRAKAEVTYSNVEKIKQISMDFKLDVAREYSEQLTEVMVFTLALLDELITKLTKLANERRIGGTPVLRAQPINGEIDYAELSREHIKRYPKIRARLAE